MFGFSFFAVFGAGVLSFLSPCVLPLVPPYLTYMSGSSFDPSQTDSIKSPVTRVESPRATVSTSGNSGMENILQADLARGRCPMSRAQRAQSARPMRPAPRGLQESPVLERR